MSLNMHLKCAAFLLNGGQPAKRSPGLRETCGEVTERRDKASPKRIEKIIRFCRTIILIGHAIDHELGHTLELNHIVAIANELNRHEHAQAKAGEDQGQFHQSLSAGRTLSHGKRPCPSDLQCSKDPLLYLLLGQKPPGPWEFQLTLA